MKWYAYCPCANRTPGKVLFFSFFYSVYRFFVSFLVSLLIFVFSFFLNLFFGIKFSFLSSLCVVGEKNLKDQRVELFFLQKLRFWFHFQLWTSLFQLADKYGQIIEKLTEGVSEHCLKFHGRLTTVSCFVFIFVTRSTILKEVCHFIEINYTWRMLKVGPICDPYFQIYWIIDNGSTTT